MNKLLVNITIPATGETYEMYIPDNIKVMQATTLIKNYLLKDSSYATLELCYSADGAIVPGNFFIYEAKISNGDKLYMI